MMRFIRLATLGAALFAGTLAAAQESTDAAADSAIVAPEIQPGQPYIVESFGDWSRRCVMNPNGADPCQLYQLLVDADGNQVAEITLFPIPNAQAAAGGAIIAPLETLLPQGMLLSVDDGTPRRYNFTFCSRAGCVSRVGFTNDEIEAFKRGTAAKLVLVPAAAPDTTVELTISLAGFTAGLNNIFAAPTQ